MSPMELFDFCSTSRVVIVAGKGGVGKTTVTATLALTATRAGLSVLIVEVEGKSGLASTFGRPPLTYHEGELYPGIRARTLTPDAALVEYLEGAGLQRVSKRLAKSGVLDIVATAVPGMKEILVLGKIKQLDLDRAADLVIVDAPAAGHTVSFLMSPKGLVDAVRVGPIRKQALDVIEMLSDPKRTQVLMVTIPEETPVNELIETAYTIEDQVGVALGPVVVNCCYPELELSTSTDAIRTDAQLLGLPIESNSVAQLADAAAFRTARQRLQHEQTARLLESLPLPQIRLPNLFRADIGPPELDVLADAFAVGVGQLPASRVGP